MKKMTINEVELVEATIKIYVKSINNLIKRKFTSF